jgi:mannosyl-3-phosphoglycerate phosphatase
VRILVLTDLDGTLLDAHTYDWSPARPALARLAALGIPLLLSTSKTLAEVEALRRDLDHHHPFIVENGGAIYVPAGYFADDILAGERRDGYDVIELGIPYRSLVGMLDAAASAAGVSVRGWQAMDVDEVARRCEMTPAAARLAMARAYDEPFIVEDDERGAMARLGDEVARLGARLTRGDRFFHIVGAHDKGTAARRLIALFERAWGEVTTIAIGDALNDVAMLALVDTPIVIASPQAAAVAERVPAARVSTLPGPAGWNAAMLEVLREIAKKYDEQRNRGAEERGSGGARGST